MLFDKFIGIRLESSMVGKLRKLKGKQSLAAFIRGILENYLKEKR